MNKSSRLSFFHAAQTSSLALSVLILLMAMATRLHDLETRSLWEDEGWTLVLAEGPTLPDIVQRLANDQHPPLFFAAIHGWWTVAGQSEFSLRMLTVFAGLIGVAGIYQLGRVMFDRQSGLLAALVLALMDLHIDLSQDVRHYSPMVMFVILSSWFYFRLIKSDRPSHGTRIGYFLTSVAALYTNYLSGYVLICHAIHLLLFVRPWKRLWWSGFHFVMVCTAFLPWLPIFLQQNSVRWDTPLYYLNSLPMNHDTYVMIRDALVGKQYAITAVLLLLGIVILEYRDSKFPRLVWRPIFGQLVFLGVWMIGYLALIYIINQNPDRQFLTLRNFLVVTPAIALLIGHGFANLQAELRTLMVVVWVVMSLSTYDTHQLKPPWREVTQNITALHNEDEPILMDIWVGDFSVRYYIKQQMGPDTEWLSIREAEEAYKTNFLPVLYAYVRDREAFWLVYWGDTPIDYEGIFEQLGFRRTASPYEWHVGDKLYAFRYDRFATDAEAITFTEGETPRFAIRKMRLPQTATAGETIKIEIWWTAETPPPVDFSLSLFLQDATGNALAPVDGAIVASEGLTSQWQVGQLYYLTWDYPIPPDLPSGEYQLGGRVYFYQSADQPLQTPCPDNPDTLCDAAYPESITIIP